MKHYSRLSRIEEKRNIKKAIGFVVLTIVLIVFIFFIGIPILGKFTGFISDLGKSDKPIANQDTTPPAPPRISILPDFTNQQKIDIAGTSEAGSNIKVVFNGSTSEVLADKDGKFVFSFSLKDGDNIYSALATDSSGNVGQKTQEYKVIFDNKPPEVTIESPTEGSQFFGAKQKQATIKGITEGDCQVTINGRIISVDSSGNFQYTTTLNDGENKFNIKSLDQAENLTEKDLVVTFSS